ncbi:hypothetical protein [Curtobacterium ammoniigenes]|uniref:hypothetical protein n=1 Tax=Curtobacterium ammoniigenes TaxID=395387 RepID=UPI000AFAC47B|nr:hypothetical protein [Curtobacterium ammoniigenes]
MAKKMSRQTVALQERSALVEGARAVIGAAHLVAPGRGPHATRGTIAVSRILGARQIVQAILIRRSRTADAHTLGAAVDATHAVSMLPLMLVSGRFRRFAGRQFVTAIVFAVLEISMVGRGEH